MIEAAARRVGWPAAALVTFALGCAVSLAFGGFYDLSLWGAVELGLLVAVMALVVWRAPSLPTRAWAALGGLLGLAVWSWLSRGWGESADAAQTGAGRWFLYATALAALLLALRARRDATLLVGTWTAGVLGVAAWVLAQMLAGDGPAQFLTGRLNGPLGFIDGEAGFLLLGIWPLLALAERRRPALSAPATGAIALLGALLVLTQSRGMALAAAVTCALVLAAVPGRARRLWVLLVAGAAVAAALPFLLDVRDSIPGPRAFPPAGTVRAAATATLVAALGAAGAWALLCAAHTRLVANDLGNRRRLRTATGWAAAAAVGLVALAGLVRAGAVADRVQARYDAFVHLHRSQPGTSRFLSGEGHRYDYWRVAVREFEGRPLAGLGAGNYDRRYYEMRRTTEDVRQPHSLGLQTLAELGLAGGLLLVLFLGAVVAGLGGLAVRACRDPWARGMAVAAGGTFCAWVVHTNVDWLHLIPGVTGVALCAAGVALRPWEAPARAPVGRSARAVALAATAGLVIAGGTLTARAVWAEHLRAQASAAVVRDPARAVRRARDALALNPDSLPARYAEAAAYARLDDYARARAALRQAVRREPHNFVPWALLGDPRAPPRRPGRGHRRLPPRHRSQPARRPPTARGAGGRPGGQGDLGSRLRRRRFAVPPLQGSRRGGPRGRHLARRRHAAPAPSPKPRRPRLRLAAGDHPGGLRRPPLRNASRAHAHRLATLGQRRPASELGPAPGARLR